MTIGDFDVLLLDFGGVCLVSPVELHHVVEQHFDLDPGTFTWMGPLDPDGDELYARSIGDGDLSEREYWTLRAAEVAATAGVELDLRGYMNVAYDAPDEVLVRPEAVDVADRARRAGIGVSVFTNDLRAFHGDEWVLRIDFLHRVDHVVDCSYLDFLKPDPLAYRHALHEIGAANRSRILFVDDQPLNVAGAADIGMTAMWFDIADPAGSWKRVADRLGI